MEIHSVERFLAYWERVRARTLRVAACIPPDRIEWRPTPEAFSFGDLLRHLGSLERDMFAETVTGHPSRYGGHGEELASGYDEVVAYFARQHEAAVARIRELRDEDLAAPCTTPAGATLPRWKWLRALVEHEIHHRGQIYLMLRMIGAPSPPLYGLTSEEVRERSRR